MADEIQVCDELYEVSGKAYRCRRAAGHDGHHYCPGEARGV